MTTETNPDQSRPGVPRWLMPVVIGALVLLAALIALVLTRGPTPVAVPGPAPVADVPAVEAPAAGHSGLNPDGPPVEQISLTDARARFDAGTAIFVDVRPGKDFAAGHIPGALTITSAELESRLKDPGVATVIIAYGDATRPESGMRGAQIFMELGYPKVIALEGGFQAWRDAGHPVEPRNPV